MATQSKYTIRDFDRQFPDDDACLEWLTGHLYPNGIFCKVCRKTTRHHRMTTRRSYSCGICGHHVHPTAGTIYHRSRTPLRLWFYATFLMASTRCGISAKQLERELGVTYKTAWRMFTEIRKLLTGDGDGPISGDVEVDETYIGGKRRGDPQGRPGPDSHKTPVAGIAQRRGGVVARVVPDVRARTLIPLIQTHVIPASGTVYTDELSSYNRLSRTGYTHERVRHSARVYVSGNAHTNTIEGFWSLVKRGISGVYHSVSRTYLQSYLDEYAFRYNHRDDGMPMFTTMLRQIRKSAETRAAERRGTHPQSAQLHLPLS